MEKESLELAIVHIWLNHSGASDNNVNEPSSLRSRSTNPACLRKLERGEFMSGKNFPRKLVKCLVHVFTCFRAGVKHSPPLRVEMRFENRIQIPLLHQIVFIDYQNKRD